MPLRVVKIQLGTESGGKFTENPTAFARCVASVSKRGGAYDPKAVCASAGRKKYGKKKFAKMAAAGRKRAAKKRNALPSKRVRTKTRGTGTLRSGVRREIERLRAKGAQTLKRLRGRYK